MFFQVTRQNPKILFRNQTMDVRLQFRYTFDIILLKELNSMPKFYFNFFFTLTFFYFKFLTYRSFFYFNFNFVYFQFFSQNKKKSY